MPKRCSICVHKKRKEIDAAILEGNDQRTVAKRFSVSEWSVGRHRRGGHIEAAIIRASQMSEIYLGDSLVDQLRSLQQKALSLLTLAEESGDYRTALAGVREARGSLEVLVDALSKLKENPAIQQHFISFDQAQIGEVVRALLDTGALALPEAVEREEALTIEGDDLDSTMGDRSEPQTQIG